MIKTKPLKWQKVSSGSFRAQTQLGEFWVSSTAGAHKILRRWVWDNDFQDDHLSTHKTVEIAKTQAQKHFDILIKTELTT